MKKIFKILISSVCAAVFALPLFAGCDSSDSGDKNGDEGNTNPTPEKVDYAGQVHLDLDDPSTKKQEVKVRLFIDGDTTHFDPLSNVSDFAATQNYIKARYLAVNTPESTGTIEKWGKTASIFTKTQLESAESIIVESDDDKWNIDSTGERYLLWIWYKPAGADDYRNLNIELLQEGYGKGSAIVDSRYEKEANLALIQAQNRQEHVFSPASTVDVNFFEGEAANITLRELRFHAQDYEGRAVRVEGTVVARFSNSAYIEDYDEEVGTSYGFSVFYGYNTGKILDILTVGNRVSVRGKVTEFQGTYQISDVDYDRFEPDAETNTFLLDEETVEIPFKVTDAKTIVNGTGNISAQFEVYDEELGEETLKTFSIDSREAIMSTSVTVEHLKITRMYTTNNGGDSDGAISIYCVADDGTEITVRTQVLKKNDKSPVTEADFTVGGYITVKGIVDKFTDKNGKVSYQVAVHKFANIECLTA